MCKNKLLMRTNYYLLLTVFLLLSCSKHVNISDSKPLGEESTAIQSPKTTSLRDEAISQEKEEIVDSVNVSLIETDDYYKKEHFRFENYIYKDNIKTALLYKEGWQLSSPVFELNSNEKIKLSFDDLDADSKNYYYTIIHCNANWEPSDIRDSEYIEGFIENQITDYKFSFNTMQNYTHYNLVIPNEDLKVRKSGNYILKVYLDNDPDNVVLSSRFMVVDRKITIQAKVKQATSINDRNYKQEIDFTIIHKGYDIADPYGDIKVIITQNDRWDNAIKNLKPLFIRNNELIYDYDEDNVFSAGNEYRHFDIKSMRYQSERIRKITFELSKQVDSSLEKNHHVYLLNDEKRSIKRYSSEIDINGKQFIKTDEGTDSETEADYAYVHFSLLYDAPLIDGNLYVFGAISLWNFSRESQLKYNYKRFAYETTMYLKQGYYNYEYVFLQDGETVADNTFIEGSHYETENDYTIYVYHNSFGDNYDQLIAVEKFNSRSPR